MSADPSSFVSSVTVMGSIPLRILVSRPGFALGKAAQRHLLAEPVLDASCRRTAIAPARREIVLDARRRRDLRARSDRHMAIDADLAAEHDEIAERDAAGERDHRDDDAVPADDDVVA